MNRYTISEKFFPVAARLSAVVSALALGVAVAHGETRTTLSLHRTVMGRPSADPNIVKALDVVYDESVDKVYVAGTLTGHVARMNASMPTTPRSFWKIQDDRFEGKTGVWDGANEVLWHVAKNGKNIYASDPHGIRGSGLVADYELKTDLEALAGSSQLGDFPIKGAVVDRNTGILWIGFLATDPVVWHLVGYALRELRPSIYTILPVATASTGDFLDMAYTATWQNSTHSGTRGALALLRNSTGKQVVDFMDLSGGTPQLDSTLTLPATNSTLTKLAFGSRDLFLAGKRDLMRFTYRGGTWNGRTWNSPVFKVELGGRDEIRALAVHPTSLRVALLYLHDEDYADTGHVSSPFSVPYNSWLDVYGPTKGALLASWDVGYEAGSVDAVGSAGGSYEFVVGSGGKGKVFFIPESSDGVPRQVQVGISAEYLLLPKTAPDKVFVLSRLGGNMLVVQPQSATGTGTRHDETVVGPWPCGMAQSSDGKYLYVLSHYDRSLRVLKASTLASTTRNNDTSALLGTTQLAPKTAGDPTYQITDALSSLASSSDGQYHLALFNEHAEVQFLRTSGASVSVEYIRSYADLPPEGGPGRFQGAVGTCSDGSSAADDAVAFVYSRQGKSLQRFVRNAGTWSYAGWYNLGSLPESNADDEYKTGFMHFNADNCTVSVHERVFDASTMIPTLRRDLSAKSHLAPPPMRILAARSSNRLFGQHYDPTTEDEHLRDLQVAPAASEWASYTQYKNYTMKSAQAMREAADGTWEGAFSQPHLGRVYWWTDIP